MGVSLEGTILGQELLDILNVETLLALPIEGLQAVILQVLDGSLKAKEGILVPSEKVGGPRGPTAKVAPRLEACRSAFIEMAGRSEGVTAKDLLGVAGDRFVYTDVLLVARNLTSEGLISETRKGRKATWHISE